MLFINSTSENRRNNMLLNAIEQAEIMDMIDMCIKLELDPYEANELINEIINSSSENKRTIFNAMSVLSDSRPFVDAAQRMAAYDTLCSELSQLNTMRGGIKGFKGFVGESMEAANATAIGRATHVVNNNGPVDLIFEGKNGHLYPQQVKIGYKPGQIDFSKYKGQTVIVDKGNPYLHELQAEGLKCGVKVIEGTVTEAEAKWWADAMQLECKVTGNTNSYIVPQVQKIANNLSAMHETGLHTAKTGAMYGAGFSIGKNIVGMMRGDVTAGEAAANVAVDTAVSGAVSYGVGAVGSAAARTVAGRAIATGAGVVGEAIAGTSVGGAVIGGATAVTGAIGGAAASATGAAIGAVGAAGSAVGAAAVSATAGTAIGGAVAAGVGATAAAGAAIGAAAVAAAPVVAVGAVVGGLFSLFFGDD